RFGPDARPIAEFDDSVTIAKNAGVQPHVHASFGELASGIYSELFTKLRQNDRSRVNHYDAQIALMKILVKRNRIPQEIVDGGNRLHTGKSAARYDDRHQWRP